MKKLIAGLSLLLAGQMALSDGTNFRYTQDESAAEPVWTETDSFKTCMDGLISNGEPILTGGHMVIEVLRDASISASDILNWGGQYWAFKGHGGTMTLRSGGTTRQTLTYTGTHELWTWMDPTIIFTNIVLTASSLSASSSFFYPRNGATVKMMNGAEIANCPCRGVQLDCSGPFTMYAGSSIHDNTSSGNGGGVLIGRAESSLVLAGGTIYGNTAVLGGGVYHSAAGKIVYAEGTSSISGNTSTGDSTGANVYATVAALPFFRVEGVASGQVFDYNTSAAAVDGIIYGNYTCEDADILSHFLNKYPMPAESSVVAEDGEVRVSSSLTAPLRYSTDGGTTWLLGTDLRAAIDAATSDGKTIIELMSDVDYSSSTYFAKHNFTLRTKPGVERCTVTLKSSGYMWLNTAQVVLSNVVFTAASGYAPPYNTAFWLQCTTTVSSLTLLDGAEIRDIPTAAIAEHGYGVGAGSFVSLGPGAKIVRCGNASVNGGAFVGLAGTVPLEMRGGEISSCTGKYGGVYLTCGSKMRVYSDSVVTGCVNKSGATANVFQTQARYVEIASSAVTGANRVGIATPEGNDGELVATVAEGLETFDVPATALGSDDNADATVVRSGSDLFWSTTRPHLAFRYSNDGLLYYETNVFKGAYVSPVISGTPLTVELMSDANLLNDDSDVVSSGWIYINRQIVLRSHGTERHTLTRKGGANSIFFWSVSNGSVISNIVITADEDYAGTYLIEAGAATLQFGEGCEIRPTAGVRAVYLGAGGVGPNFTLLPGAAITGANVDADGAVVYNNLGTLTLQGGAVTGNVGRSAVYLAGDKTQVRVSGGARLTDNVTSSGQQANIGFNGANGLFVQTGDLTEGADVRLSRNDVQGGVFGVSSNLTAGCYQAWQGTGCIRSDVKNSYTGKCEESSDAVNLVWERIRKGVAVILK